MLSRVWKSMWITSVKNCLKLVGKVWIEFEKNSFHNFISSYLVGISLRYKQAFSSLSIINTNTYHNLTTLLTGTTTTTIK